MPRVPMFPLGAVLFPHTPLPLRIFEPRYLTMLGRLLDEPDPAFGVVLIERGHEVGGGDHRTGVGTMARIIQVGSSADAMHVVTVGGDRFAVDDWADDEPYPSADVGVLPPLTWDDALTPLRTETEHAVRRVVARAERIGGEAAMNVRWDAATELSDDPVESAWQLAALAPLGEFDRQALLRSTTAGGLLGRLLDLTLECEQIIAADDDLAE